MFFLLDFDPRDAVLAGFLFYSTIMFGDSLGRAFALGFDWCCVH